MQLVSGRKGAVGHRCSVAGLEADVNLSPTGVDAIYDAARLIAFIADRGDELANGHYDDGFDIWHSILSIGMVEGGAAFNVVAGACEFTLDRKNAPQVDRHAISARIIDFATTTLLPGMVDVYPRANIRFERMLARLGCELPADDPLIGQLGGDDWLQ
jgi:acetylornithine deacetylase